MRGPCEYRRFRCQPAILPLVDHTAERVERVEIVEMSCRDCEHDDVGEIIHQRVRREIQRSPRALGNTTGAKSKSKEPTDNKPRIIGKDL